MQIRFKAVLHRVLCVCATADREREREKKRERARRREEKKRRGIESQAAREGESRKNWRVAIFVANGGGYASE